MNILHIWDQAGVAYTIAKFQRKQGDESQVIRVKGPDKYCIDQFYRNYGAFVTSDELVSKSVAEAEKADVIHIHSVAEMAINIRKIYGKSKLIILHYHGTDIRGFCEDKVKDSYLRNIITPKKILRKMLRKRMHIKAQRSADRVIVGTPDLIHLVKGSVLSHIPVDTDHFKLPVEHCPMNVTTRLSYIYSQKRNKLELVKLVLEQLPLAILYGLYSLLKKMSSMKV